MEQSTYRQPSGARRFVLAIVAAVLLAAGLLVSLSGSARASVIDGAIKSVTVTPRSVTSYTDRITTNVSWCVPDGTKPGDTFSMTIPGQFSDYPTSFALKAADGSVVAAARISGDPAVATFTMSRYAATHEGICGTAFFTANIGYQTAGTTQTLTYTTSAGQTFRPTVTVPAATGIARDVPHKWGHFSDGNDQCGATAKDCVTWVFETPVGPLDGGTITDQVAATGAAWTFDCATVTASIGNATGGNNAFSQGVSYSGATVTCTDDTLKITYGAFDTNAMLQFTVKATAATANPAGNITYDNTAAFDLVGTDGEHRTVDSSTSVTSANAGGNGNGTVPVAPTAPKSSGTGSSTDISVLSTSRSSNSTSTPSGTTTSGPAAATSATTSSGTSALASTGIFGIGPMSGAAAVVLIAGGLVLMIGRRRRSAARR
ncbi:hypothetical protein SAMN04515671_1493 [Nakamurella panacisegetis]|uniref:SDR-like Ig domain-containing protein n=1 Tax=Nakamurella panacisegetis TaxID=1090615 RepID=A0A1H0L0E1_9ACTN|nr:Ig-like domain-containing protein [Nakamurella panacisegetis]SDO61441.1 hypothetical protein SAMN04515671_1493 [Nakamurella panacisegetis]